MIETIKSILNFLKLSVRHFGICAIFCLIALGVPDKFLKTFNITTLNSNIRLILFILLSVSLSGLAVQLITFLSQKTKRYLFIKKGKARLKALTKEEKDMLRPYFLDGRLGTVILFTFFLVRSMIGL